MSSNLQAGWALFHASRYRDAMTAAARHLGDDPNSYEARCLLAFCHKGVGELDLALEHAKEALAKAPSSDYVYRTLAWVQTARGETMEAIHSATRSVELDPDDGWNHYTLGFCFERVEQYDAAISCANAAIERIPTHAEFLDLKARCLVALGRKEEAAIVVAEALRSDPENQNARTTLGFLSLDQGAQSAAYAEFREAMRLDPNYRRAQIGYLEATRRSHWLRFVSLGATPQAQVRSRRLLILAFFAGIVFLVAAGELDWKMLGWPGMLFMALSPVLFVFSWLGSLAMQFVPALRADTRALLPETERRRLLRIALVFACIVAWVIAVRFRVPAADWIFVLAVGFALYLFPRRS